MAEYGCAEDLSGFVVRSLFGERLGVVVEASAFFILVRRGRITRRNYVLPRSLTVVRVTDRTVVVLADVDDVLVDGTPAETARERLRLSIGSLDDKMLT